MDPNKLIATALRELSTRATVVHSRLDYYNGNHPSQLGSESWNKSYRDRVAYLIDNQCRLIVNTTADAVVPAAFKSTVGDTLSEGLALWSNDLLLNKYADTTLSAIRTAEATGVQTTVLVDVDEETGDVVPILLDPRSTYVAQSTSGAIRGVVYLWTAEDGYTQATVLTREWAPLHYASTSKDVLPTADTFDLVTPLDGNGNPPVNVFGEVPVAVIDKGVSVIDSLRGLQDLLNKSLQTQAITDEAYALPFRVWLGIESYNPETGERLPMPNLNPATGSRDIILPTSADPEGGQRSVTQYASPSPGVYLEEQDNLRAAMARQGSVPPFQLTVGGQPPSGDALEQAYLPHISMKATNERLYGPWLARIARLAVRRRLYEMTGVPLDAPELSTSFSTVTTSPLSSRVEHVRTAVEAGMTLEDALVEFLGWNREAAQEVTARADEQAAERAASAARLFDAGVGSTVAAEIL